MVRWFAERKMRVALGAAAAVAIFHVADCAVLRLFADPPFVERQVDGAAWRAAGLWATGQPLRPLFPRQPRADKLRDYAEWLDVCRWIADQRHTPRNARFIVPRVAYTFKWYAGRGEVVNWKESPQDAAGLHEWWQRINDIYATGKPSPNQYYGSLRGRRRREARRLGEGIPGGLPGDASQRAAAAPDGRIQERRLHCLSLSAKSRSLKRAQSEIGPMIHIPVKNSFRFKVALAACILLPPASPLAAAEPAKSVLSEVTPKTAGRAILLGR